ncbi:uncharacterized protein CFAP97D2 [Lampris incognitus]|uniref:uncharacterized protein CFAP97D2 n=1 Tax=Lampris incognitus TaxID=2546036 RepID=UPI0024B5901A|nr:uncharacterized protein CFAP97D2 [Lampris incognitus]
MHRAYQPLKPATNRFLQQRWDQSIYEDHRRKVSSAQPAVDARGTKAPAHVQLKLKKVQLQHERQAIIDRDNHLLSSRLADIVLSKGLVDHRNHYLQRSLNTDKRRAELLHVTCQNQAVYRRITARQSEYRRQLWLKDWEKVEQRRNDITRYPRAPSHKQRTERKVRFAAGDTEEHSNNTEATDTD